MGKFVNERFAYLDDDSVIQQLAQFRTEHQINVTFALPQMHCASCIYLLEHLHKINPGIIHSQANFQKKEVFISFHPQEISLRKVVELLAFIGYEPHISLNETGIKQEQAYRKKRLYHLGVAGFCFANIMMLSFPEYFSSGNIGQAGLKETFTWIIFGLSLPVLFYAASSIFQSAWKGLLQKDINIDVPIAFASIMTFGRSYYEIFTGTGPGYLDSGTGIIFFMLVGRWFQNMTYDSLSFDRDYQAYFPLGVTVIRNQIEQNIPATKLEKADTIVVRNGEMIPADAILESGEAWVDYSFVSGEETPVPKKKGDLIYAGGKQTGGAITLKVVKEVSQSYITQLWNNDVFTKSQEKLVSFVHPWSRFFTAALFSVAIGAGVYWYFHDPANLWPAVTAVLIVACPCSLLLTATFTFGGVLRQLGKNKLFLKNATVIEGLGLVDTVVFDKTGTITLHNHQHVAYQGSALSIRDQKLVKTVAAQSAHSLSRFLSSSLEVELAPEETQLNRYQEISGKGIDAVVNEVPIKLGAAGFMTDRSYLPPDQPNRGSRVYVMIAGESRGYFEISQQYREGLPEMAEAMKSRNLAIHVLSGDHDGERPALQRLFGKEVNLRFNASPQEKLDYIRELQAQGKKVLMIGDGLNDAGALKQADVGMAVSDHSARFTPASDAIIDGGELYKLHRFIDYARSAKTIVTIGFIVSILYNFIGLSFAASASLSPLVAAILMPASSITLVSLATLLGRWFAHRKRIDQ